MIRKALWFTSIVAAASDNKVICPEDAYVFGYDSIDALNQDMKAIFDAGAYLPKRSHVFRLCPHTIFDGSERLTPLLNDSHFVCGSDGNPVHKCTISGGKHQIYIADYPGSNVEYVSFRGITLSDSEEFGVAALSHSGIVADFFDCQWVDGHGVSGVHILYEAYAENTQAEAADEDVLYPEIAALSPEDNNETIDNVFEHRGLAIANSGMTVRIYNSTFMDIHQYGFQATYNTGNLYMFNVSMKNIQAGVLNNIMAGNATIESCIFESIDSVSVIRAVRSRMVEIRDTKFVDSTGTGMVTAMQSNVTISNCQFVRNSAPRGGEVLAFASTVELNDTCIIDSTSMAPVFRSSSSRLLTSNVFGQDIVGDYCPGILFEDEGSSCFSGGNCTGQCVQLTGSGCGEASAASSLPAVMTWGFLACATFLVFLFSG